MQTVPQPRQSSGVLADLLMIFVHPRRTVRRVVDRGRDPLVLPLVFLAMCSGIASDIYRGDLRRVIESGVGGTVALILLACIVALIGVFYAGAGLVTGIGRILDGEGKFREVVSALAWGLAPIVWALLYRIPALIYGLNRPAPAKVLVQGEGWQMGGGLLGPGWESRLALGAADFLVAIAAIVITSITVGEVHRFSALRGLGTLTLSLFAPAIALLIFAIAAL
jgi:hypothetical protein